MLFDTSAETGQRRLFSEIMMTQGKENLGNMTENMQADDVQRR